MFSLCDLNLVVLLLGDGGNTSTTKLLTLGNTRMTVKMFHMLKSQIMVHLKANISRTLVGLKSPIFVFFHPILGILYH